MQVSEEKHQIYVDPTISLQCERLIGKRFCPTPHTICTIIYNIAQAAAFYCVYEVAFCTFPSRKRLLGYNTTNLEVSKLELCVCFSRRNFHEFVHT
jgi:hypothetical protein